MSRLKVLVSNTKFINLSVYHFYQTLYFSIFILKLISILQRIDFKITKIKIIVKEILRITIIYLKVKAYTFPINFYYIFFNLKNISFN